MIQKEKSENIINTSLEVVNEALNNLSNDNIIFNRFKMDYTIFLSIVYKRLLEEELIALDNNYDELGQCTLEFETSEFIYEYKELEEILKKLDGNNSENKYLNYLFNFKNMYKNFYKLIGEEFNSVKGKEKFEELIRLSLEKLGYKLKTTHIMDEIVFEIDICSRIVDLEKEFYSEARTFMEKEGFNSCVTSSNELYTWIKDKLLNWEINSNKNDDIKKIKKTK